MKFLCPSCKAKYQLADEKVAGRSVRMQCRKCGHMIQISARDAILEANAGASDAEVLSTPEPPASSPPEAPRGSWADAMTAPTDLDDDETTAIVQPKTIAAAMAAAKRAAAAPEEPAADGWFVGINGVPVGPIKLSELRSKAATGAITLESLTWRESCDEWRPLRTFPELAELVEQVQAEALRTAARIAKARSEQQVASASRSAETAMQARQAAASRVAELALAQAARMTPAPPAAVTAPPAAVTAAAVTAATPAPAPTATTPAPAAATAAPASVRAAPASVTAARPPRPGLGAKSAGALAGSGASPGAAASARVLVTPAPSRPGEGQRPAQDGQRAPGAVAPPPPSSRTSAPAAAPAVAAATATPQPASSRAVPPAKPAAAGLASKASPSVAAERAPGLSAPAPRVAPLSPSIANAPSPAAPPAGALQTVTTASGADLYPAVTPSAAPAPVASSSPFAIGTLAAPASAGARPSFTIPDPFVSATTPATLGGAAAPLRVTAEPVGSQLLGTAMRQPSPFKRIALPVLLLAAGLGAGFFLFSPGERAPVAAAPTPSVAPPAEATVALPSIPPPEAAAVPSAAPEAVEKAEPGSRPRPGTRPPPKPEGESKLTGDLKNLGSGPSPTEGPRASPVGADTAPTGTELGAGQLQSTVAKYTGGVKRSCWQPALDTRDKDAPTSARVNVTITVAPSGSVQDVSTSGDPRGYPGLASCIAGRVRGWQFPSASASTTLNVPFVFAAQ